MDEREVVDRREAVAGLGLMAGLTVALLGMIVYRIVDGSPARAKPNARVTVASQEPLTETPMAAAPADFVGAPSTFGVPTAEVVAREVDDAQVRAGVVEQASSVEPVDERPRFIAPGNR